LQVFNLALAVVNPGRPADYSLQRCLDTSSDFEAKYLDLLERQTILETREAMAIEEVEKLELQHAELLGHASRGTGGASGNSKAGPSGSANGHGMQRINYIESVRREMAMVRAVSGTLVWFMPITGLYADMAFAKWWRH
jgi:hypothetical protein